MKYGSNGRLYMIGSFTSSTLPLGSITLTLSGSDIFGPGDMFLAEMDTAGNVIWAVSPSGNIGASGIALDNDNNIYICGGVGDTIVSFGTHSFHNQNLWWGSYFAKYDTAGNPLWAHFMYPFSSTALISDASISIYEVCTDPCSNVWLTARSDEYPVGLDDTILFSSLPSSSDLMLFAGFNTSGNVLQAFPLLSGGDDNAGMVSDCSGKIYMAGDTRGWMVLGHDTLTGIIGSNENMFVAKYNPNLGCSMPCGTAETEKQNSLSNTSQITLYPNPATSECKISYTGIFYPYATVSIYDVTGRLVYVYPLSGNTTTIPLSGMPPGLYVCSIDADGQGAVVRKLVVMR